LIADNLAFSAKIESLSKLNFDIFFILQDLLGKYNVDITSILAKSSETYNAIKFDEKLAKSTFTFSIKTAEVLGDIPPGLPLG
jgi:hypothetical protein